MKKFFSKYKFELIEMYMAAAVYFTCVSGFGLSWLAAAIILGLTNSYFVIPVVNALDLDAEREIDIFDVTSMMVFTNIVKSLLICSMMVITYYYINMYWFTTYIEPISFGIIYKLIDIYLMKITRELSKLVKKTKKA
ncbi:MAG: hypothetical protein ATN35_08830 [Epulopiscium sp. Nele67-Bin004]|nr:MAG: hypothetical protein ATN35_08830 [Epulopiscium sp. Nele67-Bin004]